MVKSPLIFISTNYQSVYMSLLWKLYYALKLTMEMIWKLYYAMIFSLLR